jgi:hypothetical protein
VPVVTQEAEAGRSLELSGVVCVRVGGGKCNFNFY